MPKRNTKELTPRQREIFEWIKDFIQEHGMPPTVREIGDAFGMKSSSMFDHLKALERKGYLKRGDMGARHLILLDQDMEHDGEEIQAVPACRARGAGRDDHDPGESLGSVPIVGRAPAGAPLFAEENIVGHIRVEKKYVGSGRCFALEVEGDSMVDANIQSGDFIIVRQQPIAESGDIVVVMLGDEATIKRLYIHDERIELRPANPKYKPIIIGPDDELGILGKVVAIKRHDANGSEGGKSSSKPKR